MFLSLFHQVMGVKGRAMSATVIIGLFLSLFHQVMGVKPFNKKNGGEEGVVSIPFSSGHGGKALVNDLLALSQCFYPFFIRSWG